MKAKGTVEDDFIYFVYVSYACWDSGEIEGKRIWTLSKNEAESAFEDLSRNLMSLVANDLEIIRSTDGMSLSSGYSNRKALLRFSKASIESSAEAIARITNWIVSSDDPTSIVTNSLVRHEAEALEATHSSNVADVQIVSEERETIIEEVVGHFFDS